MLENNVKLVAAARKFRKKMLLEKLARHQRVLNVENTMEISNFETIGLKKNWPKPFKWMAFYPEHTLTRESQKIIEFVKWALALFTLALVFNALLQIVHIIRSDVVPFVLGLLYLIVLVPLVFRFVFYDLYQNLQFGTVGYFFRCASISVCVDFLLLFIPPSLGSPSMSEIRMLFQRGEPELGAMFIGTALLTVTSAIVMIGGIVTGIKGRDRLFRLAIPDTL